MATTLGTVIVFSTRMEELAAFYRDGLGLALVSDHPGHSGAPAGDTYFGIDQVEAVDAGNRVTAWFTVDDLQATFDRLVALGAEADMAPSRKPWGGFLAAVRDPDGNRVGLSQRE